MSKVYFKNILLPVWSHSCLALSNVQSTRLSLSLSLSLSTLPYANATFWTRYVTSFISMTETAHLKSHTCEVIEYTSQ